VRGSTGENGAVVVLFRGERAFSDEDLALARHLSRAARGALERSELFETERRARSLSQRLAAVGARLVTNLDPGRVLDDVVREAPSLLAADAAAIRLLEGEELVVRAAAGSGAGGLVRSRSSSGAGVLGDAVQSRQPATVEDARAAPHRGRGDPLLAGAMAACVAVPMTAHGGGLHGVLSVYATASRAWRADEVQALQALGAVASAALSNAELYQRVAEEKERNDAILSNIADAIVAVDREERIVLWNSTAEQITGVPAAEALGRRISEALQRELTSDDGEDPQEEREVWIMRGGKEVWLSVTEAVMRDASGAVLGRIFAFRDVSGERAVEEMKSDFVATVSHELRTPLTSIYGFAGTLLREDVAFGEEERSTFLRYIASESERLIGIVDDLLNVARLDSGTIGLSLKRIDVADVLSEAVDSFAARANGAHRFHVDIAERALYAEADPARLVEIVHHLVDNAVKFSPDGGTITVSGRRKAETIEVRVADEGVGIPPSEQQRIFTKFYRGGGGAPSAQGTGVGLFLARGLVAAMKGRMWVESQEGAGSTFVFELPLANGADGAPRPVSP
jgi:PAS domain S-box-containing protein